MGRKIVSRECTCFPDRIVVDLTLFKVELMPAAVGFD